MPLDCCCLVCCLGTMFGLAIAAVAHHVGKSQKNNPKKGGKSGKGGGQPPQYPQFQGQYPSQVPPYFLYGNQGQGPFPPEGNDGQFMPGNGMGMYPNMPEQ